MKTIVITISFQSPRSGQICSNSSGSSSEGVPTRKKVSIP